MIISTPLLLFSPATAVSSCLIRGFNEPRHRPQKLAGSKVLLLLPAAVKSHPIWFRQKEHSTMDHAYLFIVNNEEKSVRCGSPSYRMITSYPGNQLNSVVGGVVVRSPSVRWTVRVSWTCPSGLT